MEYGDKVAERDDPWLLITDGKKQYYKYSISEDRFHPYLAPELDDDMIVLASSFGWLVLSHPDSDDTFLWNPVSMEKIELGILTLSFVYDKCVMSKPPLEPDCNFVFFSRSAKWQSYCRLLGDQTMVSLKQPEGYNDPKSVERPLAVAAFRGTIYGFLYPDFRFVILHFGDESVEFRPILKGGGEPWDMPNSSWDSESFWEYHLIESPQEEELLLVKSMRAVNNKQELDFRVFRVDIDHKKCVELDNIGDRGIFISSRAGGFCCSSSTTSSSSGEVVVLFPSNCIYYTLDKGQSRCVFVYDLNERSTSPLLPCPVVSRTRSQRYWVQNQVFASTASN